MRKSKRSAWDIIKEVLAHIVLLFVALIVMMPILYLISAGFRTNQAIFGPFIDTNSWVDNNIADKSTNKMSKDKVLKRIIMVLDGKTEYEIKDFEGELEWENLKNDIKAMEDEGKSALEIIKYRAEVEKKIKEKVNLNKKIKVNMESKDSDIRELKLVVKEWIMRKSGSTTYDAYLNAIKKWEEKKLIPYNNLKKEIVQLEKDKEPLFEQLDAAKREAQKVTIQTQIDEIDAKIKSKQDEMYGIEDEVSLLMGQLFMNYKVGTKEYVSRYKYDVRTSFYNFMCFFTGEVPNAKNAKFTYIKWLWNSIIIAGSVAVVQVVVTAFASYALSRFRFAGKKVGLMVILTVQVFPGTMAMVALYLLLQYLGNIVPALGIDRKLGLILIYLGGGIPFNIWLVKGYFDTIPKALEESAMIDGATYWQAFTMIIVPLVRPILAVITILSFVGMYNEFVLAMVVLTSQDNFTLPVGLRFFMNAQQDARFGVFAACSIMGSLPIVALWLSLQNQIISGLTGGAVKG